MFAVNLHLSKLSKRKFALTLLQKILNCSKLLLINLQFNLIFFILEIFFFDFSNTKIFFYSFLACIALNIDEPIRPHPIINTFLNIFKYPAYTF